MSKGKSRALRTTRPGPKLRPRYCTFCGTKCEGAVVAANHCKGKGTRPVKGNYIHEYSEGEKCH